MKTITKNIFKACAILLFAAGAAMPASAAEPAAKQPLAYPEVNLLKWVIPSAFLRINCAI